MIFIVDALMGTGKTCAAINHINSSSESEKFLYITPYLTEVERVIDACKDKQFRQPQPYGTKINGIKYLLENGCNIASTHQLFMHFDEEIMDMLYDQHYTLIMDEVADVVDNYDITTHDLQNILEKYARINKSGLLEWHAVDYDGRFSDYKTLCDLESLGIYEDQAALWLFPVSTFKAFKNIYILTYLFNAQTQKYYYDYFGVKYQNIYVKGNSMDKYEFTTNSDERNNVQYPNYKRLIRIIDNEKLNSIGDLPNSLSKGWYKRNDKVNGKIDQLKKNTNNYFKNYAHAKSNSCIWTTFKKWENGVGGKGYMRSFVSCNMRATNKYKDRTAVAYLINKYLNPYVKNFFIQHGVEVDEDAFALSELLQFLFRSAIREGKPIDLYLPSSRMRNLLNNWLDEINKQ
jgi:hypothetical protein